MQPLYKTEYKTYNAVVLCIYIKYNREKVNKLSGLCVGKLLMLQI